MVEFSAAKAQLIGKCKYCHKYSYADGMERDENNKPYHKKCKQETEAPQEKIATMEQRPEVT